MTKENGKKRSKVIFIVWKRQEEYIGRWPVMAEVYRFNVQQAPGVLSQKYSRLKQKGRMLIWCM